MTDPTRSDADLALRRKRAGRTALIIAGIAVAIYIAFLLSGVAAT
jgi:hypothetical protein